MAAKLDCLKDVVGVEDLYEFLGISSDSTEKEITRGYRKKALQCHPDKNPDDPNAAELFQKLSKAYHILCDPAAKSAYDKWLSAKQAAKRRHEELNSKRKKLKESLEAKEGLASGHVALEREALQQMQKEIERLREEGFQRVKEQEEQLRDELKRKHDASHATGEEDESEYTSVMKVSWRSSKNDPKNGGYTQELLESIFSKFGPVRVVMSRKRRGKALVAFTNPQDGVHAKSGAVGNDSNPLVMEWEGQVPQHSATPPLQTPSADVDYEALTLMRLQNAELRKRAVTELEQN